jgi:hypothetical protein
MFRKGDGNGNSRFSIGAWVTEIGDAQGLNVKPVPFPRRKDDNVLYASGVPSNYSATQ